ncbi:MAG: hypothetical protein ACREH8_20810 [Opitutaceae bacterium]
MRFAGRPFQRRGARRQARDGDVKRLLRKRGPVVVRGIVANIERRS